MEAEERNRAAAPGENLDQQEAETGCPLTECIAARLQPLLRPLSEGLSNQEIAEELSLALHTVENYVSELLSEFDCSSRVRLAIQAGVCLALHKSKEQAP